MNTMVLFKMQWEAIVEVLLFLLTPCFYTTTGLECGFVSAISYSVSSVSLCTSNLSIHGVAYHVIKPVENSFGKSEDCTKSNGKHHLVSPLEVD